LGEGMFERVGDEFIDEQATGDGAGDIQVGGSDIQMELDAVGSGYQRAEQSVAKVPEVGGKVHCGEACRIIERLVDQGHGVDPVLHV